MACVTRSLFSCLSSYDSSAYLLPPHQVVGNIFSNVTWFTCMFKIASKKATCLLVVGREGGERTGAVVMATGVERKSGPEFRE